MTTATTSTTATTTNNNDNNNNHNDNSDNNSNNNDDDRDDNNNGSNNSVKRIVKDLNYLILKYNFQCSSELWLSFMMFLSDCEAIFIQILPHGVGHYLADK